MSHLGYDKNEFGHKVSKHLCESCGSTFMLIPPQGPDDGWGEGCLGLGCASYDVTRDVDLMFEIEPRRIKKKEAWRGDGGKDG